MVDPVRNGIDEGPEHPMRDNAPGCAHPQSAVDTGESLNQRLWRIGIWSYIEVRREIQCHGLGEAGGRILTS
jgi:hypothetical protein